MRGCCGVRRGAKEGDRVWSTEGAACGREKVQGRVGWGGGGSGVGESTWQTGA